MCRDKSPLEKAVDFHGHICPGLLMGLRAAEFAREYLGVSPDIDEELLAIVETDSCGADAIQAVLGCTFGKGNLIFKDYGKNAYTIVSREKNKAVRIAAIFGANNSPESARFRELGRKGQLTDEEINEREELRGVLFERIMTRSFEEMFTYREVPLEIPPKATIHATLQCSVCAEGVSEHRAVKEGDKVVCLECQAKGA
ncbi:MAG: FmdE family protein [Candidatus Saccharibacteria bacterium]